MSIVRPTFKGKRLILVLAAVMSLIAAQAHAQVTTRIVRDATPGQSNPGVLNNDQGTVTILGSDGVTRDSGKLLLHSFSEFDLAAGDTALYTDADPGLSLVENIITRISGTDPSRLEGRMESLYPNANLLFVNPNGVFTGSGFEVDVRQAFHVSTADFIEMRNLATGAIDQIDARDTLSVIPTLSMAVPHAWGYLGAGPEKLVEVKGFTPLTSAGPGQDNVFSFVGGDVTLGETAQGPGQTMRIRGRDFTVVALGGPGRVEISSAGNDTGPAVPGVLEKISTTDLNGNAIDPSGTIMVHTSIDSGGGDLTIYGGPIELNGDSLRSRRGDLSVVGTEIMLDTDLDPTDFTAGSGDLVISARESIVISNGIEIKLDPDVPNLAGSAQLVAGEVIDITGLELLGGKVGSVPNAAQIRIAAPTISLDSSSIKAEASRVEIVGSNVSVVNSEINVTTTGPSLDGGAIEITGLDELDVTGTVLNARGATQVANGGTIQLSAIASNGVDVANYDVTVDGSGLSGTIDIVQLIPETPLDPVIPEVVTPAVDSIDQILTSEIVDTPIAVPSDGPVNFGDLQPFDPPPVLAPPPVSAPAPVSTPAPAATPAPTQAATPANSSAPSQPGVSIGADNSAPQVTEPAETPAIDVQDDQLAEASLVAEMQGEASESATLVPGVSLFTNSRQVSPMVPRTCSSLAGNGSKSKLLANSGKRWPASPENWLISFDPSGKEFVAAALGFAPPSDSSPETSNTANATGEAPTPVRSALAAAALKVRGGSYIEAATAVDETVVTLTTANEVERASDTLLAFAQIQLAEGRYIAARHSLERALEMALSAGDGGQVSAIRISLGNALIGTGDLGRAEEELLRGFSLIDGSEDREPIAAALNNLGNRHAAKRDLDAAYSAYERSAKMAEKMGRNGDRARALAGAARISAESGRLAEARGLVDRAVEITQGLEDARERSSLYIHLGVTFAKLAAFSPSARPASILGASHAFDQAVLSAESSGDLRNLALANLSLGALYSDEQHGSEALYLTRLAESAAAAAEAPDILYRVHRQEGKILWSQHEVVASLAAYRRAVAILEESRPIASDQYGTSEASFRKTVGGVYLETVDLLLQASDLASRETTTALLIREARDTLERLKGAELRDYFEDECIASVNGAGRSVDQLGHDVAVVYTVMLPNRLELLVGIGGEIKRFTSRVSTARLNSTIDSFRRAVQDRLSNDHHLLGTQLYQWLVDPYSDTIANAGIKTLVFVPDGRLRTLPFSALNDGEKYLAEEYATATALSLRLLVPQTVTQVRGRPLLAGVSESVQGFSALEAVTGELTEIQEIDGGDLLLNRSFTLNQIKDAVTDELPSIVHLATHAVFTGDPDTSFLLTYDGHVNLEDLSDVVGMTQTDGAQLDLLVLSACESAVGNDRAGLGFTGSAIRAGARSALGSLWPIADQSTQTLMIDFYRALVMPEVNKAEALRRAQVALLARQQYRHPYYWAPFTLVNDWM